MKLAAREDIAAPIEAVFEQLADFDAYERAALRRGAEVQRVVDKPVPGPGITWKAGFEYRGRERNAEIELIDYDPPNGLHLHGKSSGLNVDFSVELVAMSRNRTRMNVVVDARPRTIPARLMIQSLKLARQNVMQRYRRRIGEFAADIEQRCQGRTA